MTSKSGAGAGGDAANFYLDDVNLRRLLDRADPGLTARWGATLSDFGAWVAADVDPASGYTHRQAPPVLESHDREGRLVNRVRHNPAWRLVSRDVYRRGAVALNYGPDPAPFVVRSEEHTAEPQSLMRTLFPY